MTDPNDLALRLGFEQIERHYADAIDRGESDPVVVVYRAGPEDPDRGTLLESRVGSRSDAIDWLLQVCPEAVDLVRSPDGTRPMTVIIADEGLTVYDCTPFEGFADPTHEAILRVCLETAEMEWIMARDRGLEDPVVEILDTQEGLPASGIRIGVRARSEMIDYLKPMSPEVARRLSVLPAPHTPMTIVIRTVDGVTLVNRPIP